MTTFREMLTYATGNVKDDARLDVSATGFGVVDIKRLF